MASTTSVSLDEEVLKEVQRRDYFNLSGFVEQKLKEEFGLDGINKVKEKDKDFRVSPAQQDGSSTGSKVHLSP